MPELYMLFLICGLLHCNRRGGFLHVGVWPWLGIFLWLQPGIFAFLFSLDSLVYRWLTLYLYSSRFCFCDSIGHCQPTLPSLAASYPFSSSFPRTHGFTPSAFGYRGFDASCCFFAKVLFEYSRYRFCRAWLCCFCTPTLGFSRPLASRELFGLQWYRFFVVRFSISSLQPLV